jgi:hypothetical protein
MSKHNIPSAPKTNFFNISNNKSYLVVPYYLTEPKELTRLDMLLPIILETQGQECFSNVDLVCLSTNNKHHICYEKTRDIALLHLNKWTMRN